MHNLKTNIALRIINLGIKLLPKEYQSQTFISNCMKVGIVRVNKDLNQ